MNAVPHQKPQMCHLVPQSVGKTQTHQSLGSTSHYHPALVIIVRGSSPPVRGSTGALDTRGRRTPIWRGHRPNGRIHVGQLFDTALHVRGGGLLFLETDFTASLVAVPEYKHEHYRD